MSGSRAAASLRRFTRRCNALLQTIDPATECLAPRVSRNMATEATQTTKPRSMKDGLIQTVIPDQSDIPAPVWENPPVLVTIYRFPTMEPLRFEKYAANQLHLPLRRDILHRAIVFEGDATRQGTASTKYRTAVHGSNRKIRPQKGSGMARAGDKKSPIFRGGGVAFGPQPRDFSTDLPKKIYDLAWRTALSYRYRKGELIVVDGEYFKLPELAVPRTIKEIFHANRWDKPFGKSLLVTERKNVKLFQAIGEVREAGRVLDRTDVDVKDLLELGRVIIEKKALDVMLSQHSSDLKSRLARAARAA